MRLHSQRALSVRVGSATFPFHFTGGDFLSMHPFVFASVQELSNFFYSSGLLQEFSWNKGLILSCPPVLLFWRTAQHNQPARVAELGLLGNAIDTQSISSFALANLLLINYKLYRVG